MENFVKGRKILLEDYDKISDDVKKPVLANSDSDETKKKKAEDILENISHFDVITDNNSNKAKTKVGRLCFENNINIFDILETEKQIYNEVENVNKAQSIDTVFNIINYLFFF